MKAFKRLTAAILTAALALSLAVTPAGAAGPGSFVGQAYRRRVAGEGVR